MEKRTNTSIGLIAASLLGGCVMKSTYDKEVGCYNTERQLNDPLRTEVSADQVQIKQLRDRLRVTVEDEILFPEGGWQMTSRGKGVLDNIVPALRSVADHRIEVEGHTDNVPIGAHRRHRFPTNWELSAARAAEVVKYLQQQGIDPSRLTVAGHSEYEPVEPNTTPEGRQANRRTDIDLMPIYQE